MKPYITYQPDPEAYAVNAFCVPWENYVFYAFPPFSIIQQVLQKVVAEKATGLLVVPHWPTQSWWPFLINMLINYPIILPRGKGNTTFTGAAPTGPSTAQQARTVILPFIGKTPL